MATLLEWIFRILIVCDAVTLIWSLVAIFLVHQGQADSITWFAGFVVATILFASMGDR